MSITDIAPDRTTDTVDLPDDTTAQDTTGSAVTETDTPPTKDMPTLPGAYKLLPVAQIIPNKGNVRDDAAAIPGIVENLKEDGVAGLIAPLIVVEAADDV